MDLGASSGAEGWKDVIQLLKEQKEKKERLARALSVIQQGMLRNNPVIVKNWVNEATKMLSGMLKTHKCLLESGVEIQKRLESHPTPPRKGWVSFGDRALRLWEIPEKAVAVPFAQHPEEKGKMPRRSPAARSVNAIRVSAKDGEFYADILRAMKAKVNPQNSGAEFLSICRTRREEILLVLKRC